LDDPEASPSDPSPAYTKGNSTYTRDTKGEPAYSKEDPNDITPHDSPRERLPVSKRGLERKHSEKPTWEPEFGATEATLVDFSGEDVYGID
jgi:hypothetical protein